MKDEKISNEKIDKLEKTSEKITGRGGLAFFVRYLTGIKIYPFLQILFRWVKGSSKGAPLESIFKQLFCFFVDGTSYALSRFDELKKEQAYASVIECEEGELCSSHSIKRFFRKFSYSKMKLFRRLLLRLFIWRLRISSPDIIMLDIDSFVLDNDDALKREGCEPTYKNKKGYQPLALKWDGFIIDSIFRKGSRHGNYEKEAFRMVERTVNLIRKNYKADIPVILTSDSGFFDKKNFNSFEDTGIGFICSGRLYSDIESRLSNIPVEEFSNYYNGKDGWHYYEFTDRRKSWEREWRCIYTSQNIKDTQTKFAFAKTDSLIYTNLGMESSKITEVLEKSGQSRYEMSKAIIKLFHGRGREELVHRGLKDFGTEKLRFDHFAPNAAYYFVMLIAFFIFECYKRDITREQFNIRGYASTFRRKLIDFGAKLVKTGRKKILKIPEALFESINAADMWKKCNSPPVLCIR